MLKIRKVGGLFIFVCPISLFIAVFVFMVILITSRNIRIAVYSALMGFLVSFFSFCIPAFRDDQRRKKERKLRPIEDCIKAIESVKEHAASAQIELSEMPKKFQEDHPDDEKTRTWIEPMIEFYRRLEILASSESTTPDEAIRLAEEVGRFHKCNKLKELFLIDAGRLAELIQERNLKT
jgi:hypothetical protein